MLGNIRVDSAALCLEEERYMLYIETVTQVSGLCGSSPVRWGCTFYAFFFFYFILSFVLFYRAAGSDRVGGISGKEEGDMERGRIGFTLWEVYLVWGVITSPPVPVLLWQFIVYHPGVFSGTLHTHHNYISNITFFPTATVGSTQPMF